MKKIKYVKKSFESDGNSSDTSANIYNSMLKSPAWKSLKPRAKVLYLTMKNQYYAQRHKPSKDYPEIPEFDGQDVFYFNQHLWKVDYALYTKPSSFYDDCTILEDRGFIKKLVSGKASFTKNIYKLSGDWRFWKEDKKKVKTTPERRGLQ